ncbi:MAG: RagB/SusD family nutrient uptake outer membrane protein [Pedobacter sp.]|nr:MAG: RagB/SusD family nutrient uptake outer membrane protein [Pedobacter sp.]
MMKYLKKIIVAMLLMGNLSCTKEFLEAKPNKALLVPTTVADMRLLLNNFSVMNNMCALQEIASDDFYLNDAGFLSLSFIEKNSYIWAADIFQGAVNSDWNTGFQQIFYSNLVIDGLLKMDVGTDGYNEINGTAHFYRGLALYNLAQLFCKPYSAATQADLGLPIRLSSDVNIKSKRSTIAQTYAQINSDLEVAERLLPITSSTKLTPTKLAAIGILARVALGMGDYGKAYFYADRYLKEKSILFDYNALNTNATGLIFPSASTGQNHEITFLSSLISYAFIGGTQAIVVPEFYALYEANDLRRQVFYISRNGQLNFRGSYSGPSTPASIFAGLSTNEMYLVRAECLARDHQINEALKDLNALLLKRYRSGTFVSALQSCPPATQR